MLQEVIPQTVPDVMPSWLHTLLGSIAFVVLAAIFVGLFYAQIWRLARFADILEEAGPNAGGIGDFFGNARRAWGSGGKILRLIVALDRVVPAARHVVSRFRDNGQGRESFAEAMLVPERDQTRLGCRPTLFRNEFVVPAALSLGLSFVTALLSVVFTMADSALAMKAWHITWITLFGFYVAWIKRLFGLTFLGLHMVDVAMSWFHGWNFWLPIKGYLDQFYPSWSAHCVMTHGTAVAVPCPASAEIIALVAFMSVWLGITAVSYSITLVLDT